MTLIEAIREAISAAINSAMLPEIIYANYSLQGLIIDPSQPPVPLKKVDIPALYTQQGLTVRCEQVQGGKLTLKAPLADGDRVAVIAHHRRQRFSVLYKV